MENIENAERFIERVNISIVFDHARAGNMFMLTLFDQHDEVLSSPVLHYIYSYIYMEYGNNDEIKSKDAYKFVVESTYFKHVSGKPDNESVKFFNRHGFSDKPKINRELIKECFKRLALKENTISRKRLITSMYAAYAIGTNRCLDRIKYILTSDAISLRDESLFKPFSGKIIDLIYHDFNNPKNIHLIRDPRASFASCNHEYTNENGNAYGINPKNYVSQLRKLLKLDLSERKGCVYITIIASFISGSKAMNKVKNKHSMSFITVKNEDLNINFHDTIKNITKWLDVNNYKPWFLKDYKPTAFGEDYSGTGAYNNNYQRKHNGPLLNESMKVSKSITGPNSYVTSRWKDRLSKHNILLLEYIFFDDLLSNKYKFIYIDKLKIFKEFIFLLVALFPITGEIPKTRWLKDGYKCGARESINRILYYLYFMPFYITSRVLLVKLYYLSFFKIKVKS
jgi:hypothetical protein